MNFPLVLIMVMIVINVAAANLTIYDKWASRHKPKHRIRERTFFLLALAGTAPGIWLTMVTIRHKTKHPSFMIGLPLIILGQIALMVFFTQ